MLRRVKEVIKRTPLAVPFIFAKSVVRRPHTQNNESAIIADLVARYDPPKCFIEFGFGGWEFNCAGLAYDWEGFLLDGDAYSVKIAKTILPRQVRAEQLWLTRDTLKVVRDYARGRDIGILSIDVDGNDYWLWKALEAYRPRVVVIEYVGALGPDLSLRQRYDPQWRWDYSSRTCGSSLRALEELGQEKGYRLVGCNITGGNAFFVRADLATEEQFQAPFTTAQHYEAPKQIPFRPQRGPKRNGRSARCARGLAQPLRSATSLNRAAA